MSRVPRDFNGWRPQRLQGEREARLHRLKVFLYLLSLAGIFAVGFHEYGLRALDAVNGMARLLGTIALVIFVVALGSAFIPRRRQ